MTLEEIMEELYRLSNLLNVNFRLPVRINNRLTRTLGRVCFTDGTPYVMEFSGPMLKTCSKDSIIQVIRHEWAHWYCWIETGKIHGHDAFFRNVCRKINCTHERSQNTVEKLVGAKPITKYTVSCSCGKTWDYARMCNTIKHINYCYCPSCGGKLSLKQNW